MRVAKCLRRAGCWDRRCARKYAATLAARREERSILLAMPARASASPDRLVVPYTRTRPLWRPAICHRGTYRRGPTARWDRVDSPLREQQVAGDDPFMLLLHLGDLRLLRRRLSRLPRAAAPAARMRSATAQAADGSAMSGAARRGRQAYLHGCVSLMLCPQVNAFEARDNPHGFCPDFAETEARVVLWRRHRRKLVEPGAAFARCPAPLGFRGRRRGLQVAPSAKSASGKKSGPCYVVKSPTYRRSSSSMSRRLSSVGPVTSAATPARCWRGPDIGRWFRQPIARSP